MDFLRLHSTTGRAPRELTCRRWYVGLAVFVLPILVIAEPLTENLSLQLGLESTEFVRLLESRVEAAQGQLVSSQSWGNPEFELSREEAGNETETDVWLLQPLDLSGRRRLDHDTGEMNIRAAQASNEVQRAERIAKIRRAFYQVLYQQQQTRLFNQWVEKFSDVENDMRKREAAGDVSGYDRLRISRENVSLLAQQRSSEAELEAVWQQLLGMIDPENSLKFNIINGHLLPGELQPLPGILENMEQYPVPTRLRRQAEAARLAAHSVARSYIPEVTIGVGHKTLETPDGDASGLMLSASVPLPLFDRKQGERQQANAIAKQAEGEYLLALQEVQADIRSLWLKAYRMSDNARLFLEQSVATSFELVSIAESSYAANEIGVLELIDAYRSALEAEINALQMALDARLIQIELDAIIQEDRS